jgi:hypothetical protein
MERKGSLITTDLCAKQIILLINESQTIDNKFVILDLDDTHILIDSRYKDWVKKEVEAKLETFVRFESSLDAK